jgi:hypothetical protein
MSGPFLPSLFAFGYHPRSVWNSIASVVKEEPWGADHKVLELYIRSNFEIAQAQGKVYEDRDSGVAFWRAGSLVNLTSDAVWLQYRKNVRDDPYWQFDRVVTGEAPDGGDGSQWVIKYDPPEFNREWSIHFEQGAIRHILDDSANRRRLELVFNDVLGGCLNEHLVFRAIYGEIQLKRKEEVVLPQWYHGEYQFLMPLFLTQGDRVELTATLQPEPALHRYVVRTLLLPTYAYAHARALVKSRANFADWMVLSETELEKAVDDEP